MISKISPRWGLLAAMLPIAAPAVGQPAAAGLQGEDTPEPACVGETCAVQDDGSLETGYGWVPSVVDGQYVQQIDSAQLPVRRLDSVCVCWLRTQNDSRIDFEVVFYDSVLDDEGEPLPQREPYASVPATATGVQQGIVGRFYEVDVGGIEIPEGISYVGVRWDAMADRFFFVCVDQTPETVPVEVFFIDEQADAWGSVFDSNDPIFTFHRAMLVRVCSDDFFAVEVPALGFLGLGALVSFLAGAAVRRLRRGAGVTG